MPLVLRCPCHLVQHNFLSHNSRVRRQCDDEPREVGPEWPRHRSARTTTFSSRLGSHTNQPHEYASRSTDLQLSSQPSPGRFVVKPRNPGPIRPRSGLRTTWKLILTPVDDYLVPVSTRDTRCECARVLFASPGPIYSVIPGGRPPQPERGVRKGNGSASAAEVEEIAVAVVAVARRGGRKERSESRREKREDAPNRERFTAVRPSQLRNKFIFTAPRSAASIASQPQSWFRRSSLEILACPQSRKLHPAHSAVPLLYGAAVAVLTPSASGRLHLGRTLGVSASP